MKLVFGDDHMVANWVAKKINGFDNSNDFGPFTAIGVQQDRKLIAGAIYSNYRDFDVEFTIASTSVQWCQKGILSALLYYPFVQLGCVRMTSTIAADDIRTLRLAKGIGFEIEGLLKKGYDGKKDAIIMGIMKEQAMRWVNG